MFSGPPQHAPTRSLPASQCSIGTATLFTHSVFGFTVTSSLAKQVTSVQPRFQGTVAAQPQIPLTMRRHLVSWIFSPLRLLFKSGVNLTDKSWLFIITFIILQIKMISSYSHLNHLRKTYTCIDLF
jgi:hypothetical protein